MFADSSVLRGSTAMRILFATAMLCGALPARAANYFVGGDGQCGYRTIGAAVTAAMASSGSQPKIYIATNTTYSNQAISLAPNVQSHITLIGGTPNCGTTTVSGNTTLNGSASASVITVRGSISVTLSHLTITGGHGSSGGGIDYAGIGNLNIDNSTISDNGAVNGGGIRFQGNGGAATMFLNANTLIIDNTASGSGGGISLQDNTTMTMDAANTWVALNQAPNGYGGGIEVTNLAHANIGSPGYLGGAAIYANTAKYGGGIGVHAGSFLNLYTTDPMHPVAIDNNTAYNTGGGLYVSPQSGYYGYICAANFRITNNIAQEGTGLYGNVDSTGVGPLITLNSNYEHASCADQLVALGGVPCDDSQACNIVHGNYAMNVQNGNTPTDGAALLLQSGTVFHSTDLDVRDNHGGYALRELGNTIEPAFYSDVQLSSCLFADNIVSHELILSSDGTSHLNLDNCTFAHDSIGASRVIAANDTLALNDSIIEEGPVVDALAFSGSQSNFGNQYNVADNATGLAATPTNIQGRPTFVDVAHGDYRLFYGLQGGQPVKSLGIDYAPPVSGNDLDIRNMPRDQAVATTPLFGVRDIGAYEMQGVGDRIFIDTFGDPLLLVH